jgi:hypothetical protein
LHTTGSFSLNEVFSAIGTDRATLGPALQRRGESRFAVEWRQLFGLACHIVYTAVYTSRFQE